jgi:DNA-binding IclR family transcriptional regulator
MIRHAKHLLRAAHLHTFPAQDVERVDRALHNRVGLRVVDLCRLTGLRRPTAHRLLQCLARENLIVRNARTRNYHLGRLVYELGVTATPSVRLEDICGPHLKALAAATGDMAFLTLRSGLDAVCIGREEGAFPIRTYTLEVGTRRPLGIGAGSLAILAALPEESMLHTVELNAVFPGGKAASSPTAVRQSKSSARSTRAPSRSRPYRGKVWAASRETDHDLPKA